MHTLKFWGTICKAYRSIDHGHEVTNNSISKFVRDTEHTNGIENFWVILKQAHMNVYPEFNLKHLQRYVKNYSGGCEDCTARLERNDACSQRAYAGVHP
ncbi:MAG: transposase [Gammaproteobacteria bacterium]|nr:transposase [Gammaproteobacteria bacterium]